SVGPSTVKYVRYKGGLMKPWDDYPVLVGSEVESEFMTLEVTNCTLDMHSINISWNNKYWQNFRNVYG
ncbi:hypothetical protein SK128_020937, partial [Halocaridina rubra]